MNIELKSLAKAIVLLALGLTRPVYAEVKTLDLDGTWALTQKDGSLSMNAQVPGNVHLDLIREGKIPDPFYRNNAAKMEWVYQASWAYERAFEVPEELLKHDVVKLHCEGLDTVADIEVNGEHVADTDNMYRTWEIDLKPWLHADKNNIRITFSPIEPYIKAFLARAPKVPNATGIDISNIRKSSYMNSWDFCARFLPCGIYKPISIIAYDTARIADVRISQDLESHDTAKLQVHILADEIGSPSLEAAAAVWFDGAVISRKRINLTEARTSVPLEVPSPRPWWPNGMGDHPLYTVTVQLFDSAGRIVDSTKRQFGLRTIELLPKTSERPLRLAVNGREIYSKGVNWVPADVFPARVTPEKLRHYVADAASANMNTLRVWGGGYYPDDAFFDACDENGILVWLDLCFACAPYPGNNPEFVENIRAELTDQVRRLRHHPSIAVWSGNNEVEGLITGFKLITRQEYDHLFHEVIGTKVKELFPEANYVGGSPEAGDEHNWWVWHVGADFEHYRQSHGWITEFGFQSFPHPATVRSYTQESERDSVLNEMNLFHQKNGNGKGNQMILDKMKTYFRPAKDFESTLWLSQIFQSYGMNIGIEHWRTDWPKSSGSIVWQYNDCWAGPSWSSVDFYGRWKAAQYGYRHAFAPLLISGVADEKNGTVHVKVASDLNQPAPANVAWQMTDLTGKVLASGTNELALPAGTSAQECQSPKLDAELQKVGRNDALLWLSISAGDKTNSNVVFFSRPKDLNLLDPKIETKITAARNGYDVTLTANAPALWTWLESSDADAQYSNNFVHLVPGKPMTIHITPSARITAKDLHATLRARSLYDTYAP